MFCNVYVAGLQYAAGLVGLCASVLRGTDPLDRAVRPYHRGVRIGGAPVRPRPRACPWVDFAKGQRKDDIAHEHLARFTGTEGVLFVGPIERRDQTDSAEKRRDARGNAYPWVVAATAWSFLLLLCIRRRLGPFFLKFCSCSPQRRALIKATITPSGRLPRAASSSRRWITGSSLSTTLGAAAICDRLGPQRSTGCCASGWRACHTLSSQPDRAAGYRYEASILQAEFSLTQMLDRPVAGRMFFEQVIRENLDIGRPGQVAADLRSPGDAPRTAAHRVGFVPG